MSRDTALRTHPRTRCGFTLVELLVAIVIIGMLVALLVPAVQGAREASRRTTCVNNLHQIGVGLQSYHQSYRTFPAGGIEIRDLTPMCWHKARLRQLAWSAMLLPFIEQKAVHSMIDFSKPFDSAENAEAAAQVIPAYLCPSVPRDAFVCEVVAPGPPRTTRLLAASDYGGILGQTLVAVTGVSPDNGTMLHNRGVSIPEIRDGTTTTLMISEDSGWRDGQWINGQNIYRVSWPINCPDNGDNEIRSEHPGGANGLFADGAVHFLNENMDRQTQAAICTRAGGDIAIDFE